MKTNFCVLFFATILVTSVIGSLQGPEADLEDKSKQYERKSAKSLESEHSEAEDEKTSAESGDETDEQYVKILAEGLNMPTGGITIIKAPDLSKDSDNKKISETLAMMLESQEKWIQKFEEELEEMNKQEKIDVPVVDKTAEEIEGKVHDASQGLFTNYCLFVADNLYDQALTILNKTKSSNRADGFALLHKAAEKGHKLAKVNIAWAHLLGNPLDLRLDQAKMAFEELAEGGMPEAHMGLVSCAFMCFV